MRRSESAAGPGWIGSLAMCVALVVSGCGSEAEIQPVPTEPEQPEVDFIQVAVWAPGGDRLLAAWHQGGRYRLYGVLGPDTTGSALEPGSGLRLSEGPDLWPTWSSDGSWVAFSSTRDGGYDAADFEIYLLDLTANGEPGQLLRLTHSPGPDLHVRFSPDGEWIVYTSFRGGFNDEWDLSFTDAGQAYGEIYAQRLSDGLVIRLTHNKWEDGPVAWGRSPVSNAARGSK